MIYPEDLNKLQKIDSVIPQTHACIIMGPNTTTNFTNQSLPEDLRMSIKSLGVNYLKNDEDFMTMCSKVSDVVSLFNEIEQLKFNVMNAPDALVNNIILNLHDKVTKRIEIKVNVISPNHSTFVAKNCQLQLMYVNPVTNANEKKFFTASQVQFNADSKNLNTNKFEGWTKIANFSRLILEDLHFLDPKYEDIWETNYSINLNSTHLLVRK